MEFQFVNNNDEIRVRGNFQYLLSNLADKECSENSFFDVCISLSDQSKVSEGS